MRITIIIPPLTDFYFTPHRFANHGANILKELLIALGHEVAWFNFPLTGKKNKSLLPSVLEYLKPYIVPSETGRLAYFTHYWRFGPALEDCLTMVKATKPKLIFMACFAFCYTEEALRFAGVLKADCPSIPLVLGGAGVTAFPEYFFNHAPIDFIITREVETSLKAFIQIMSVPDNKMNNARPGAYTSIPNLYWRENGTIRHSNQIRYTEAEEIYFTLSPAFETRQVIYLTTSLTRGCPRQCRFCINASCHGKHFRTIPLTKVARGLKAFKEKFDPEAEDARVNGGQKKKIFINFEDDNILLQPEYFLNALNLFRAHFPEAEFLLENGMDYSLLTEELVIELTNLGLKHFNLSLASADLQILKNEQRFFKPDHFIRMVNRIQDQGGTVISYFIAGFKEDTRESLLRTLLFLAGLPTSVGISPYYALPGLPGFTPEQFDSLSPLLCAGSSVFPWNKTLTTVTLVTAFRLSRFINLLKDPSQTEEEKELIQVSLRDKKLYTVIKIKKERRVIPVEPVDKELVRDFFERLV